MPTPHSIAAILLIAIMLTSCADTTSRNASTPATSTATKATSTATKATSTVVTTTTVATTTTVTAPNTAAVQQDSSAALETPVLIECLSNQPGIALWSNGTTTEHEWCRQQVNQPQPPQVQQQADIYYETSGEAQAHHGCQEGYIDNPELCAVLFEKYGP